MRLEARGSVIEVRASRFALRSSTLASWFPNRLPSRYIMLKRDRDDLATYVRAAPAAGDRAGLLALGLRLVYDQSRSAYAVQGSAGGAGRPGVRPGDRRSERRGEPTATTCHSYTTL